MAYEYPPPAPFWTAVPGFFDYADVYQNLVNRALNGETIVEVGSYLGRSACFLGEEVVKSGKKITILCVDLWPPTYKNPDNESITIWHESTFETFYANVRQSHLTKIIIPIRASSLHAASFVRNNLASVFIDADHSYEGCLADIKAWLPKVKKGGLLCGHDFSDTFPGVPKAVREMFGNQAQVFGQTWVYKVP